MNEHKAKSDLPPGVGRSETFPTGRLTFLSPKPLPTAAEPIDYGHVVTDIGESCLDFGTGVPPVFGWQATIGIPFFFFLLLAFVLPFLALLGGFVFGDGWEDALWGWRVTFDFAFWIAVWGGLFGFVMLSLPRWQAYGKLKSVIPTRFNRQRREVCFVPEGGGTPIFVPWEELVAWITEAQGFTEYGIQRQYGFGVGFFHPDTGKKHTLEFETYGRSQAIST
ncbi:hypothetical protein [uncultured Marinobacter sp.]|uniref:hypothetical protein n=1 Tax=uncultured Marinobacter sp. TaxID=187379 RepID=UPI00262EF66F|nr:hypothetical protein [uncultured Marinobacter sp.]